MNLRTFLVVLLLASLAAASAYAEEYRITIPDAQRIYNWEDGTPSESVDCYYDFGHQFTCINSVSIHVTGTIIPGIGVLDEMPPIPPPPSLPQGIVTSESSEVPGTFSFNIWNYAQPDPPERYTSVRYSGAFDAVSMFKTDFPPLPPSDGNTDPPAADPYTDHFTDMYNGCGNIHIYFYCYDDRFYLPNFVLQTPPVGQLDSVELVIDGTVPEPGSLAVLLCGLGGFGAAWHKRR